MSLEFNEDRHEYKLDGVVIPSVTQILAPLNDFSHVDPDVLRRAQDFGTAVHKATELYDADDLGSFDPALAPYLDAWITFRKDSNISVMDTEHRVVSRTYRYAGTIDRVGLIGGKDVIVDIKTGSAIPVSVGPQTAAYVAALKEQNQLGRRYKFDRLCVQLNGDGTYSAKRLDNPLDLPAFHAYLTLHNWKKSQ